MSKTNTLKSTEALIARMTKQAGISRVRSRPYRGNAALLVITGNPINEAAQTAKLRLVSAVADRVWPVA